MIQITINTIPIIYTTNRNVTLKQHKAIIKYFIMVLKTLITLSPSLPTFNAELSID